MIFLIPVNWFNQLKIDKFTNMIKFMNFQEFPNTNKRMIDIKITKENMISKIQRVGNGLMFHTNGKLIKQVMENGILMKD